MTLDLDQVTQIQIDLMNRKTWETKSDRIPDTDEAHAMWDRIAAQLAEGHAKGWIAEIPNP